VRSTRFARIRGWSLSALDGLLVISNEYFSGCRVRYMAGYEDG
jgi:hypothetical protein